MGARSTIPGLSIAVALGALVLGCDDSPNRLARFPGAPSPAPNSPSALSNLTIDGPPSVPPGGTAQFAVTARYSNGVTRDATAEATWRSSNEAVLTLSPGGLARALERGEVSITASIEGRTAVKNEVMVLPAGTFRLSGLVAEQGVPIVGARVVVTSGEGAGQSATASVDGRFRLYGVAAEVEVRASQNGYLDAAKRVHVSSHQSFIELDLSLARPRPDLAGTHTLTITAASTCLELPEEARVRTYTAMFSQSGPKLEGTLHGAEFLHESYGRLNRLSGTVWPDVVTFKFNQPWGSYYLPDLVEVLNTGNSSYLTIVGDAATTSTSTGLSGTLAGVIETLSSTFRRVASCQSASHRFALSQ